ncbi:MAG: hypothetical protein Q8P27_03095 [Candidatus Peregrinibacteria bacterium]|nr:hypothetical protein [Candidatus Peregrinibacteria bacterium]
MSKFQYMALINLRLRSGLALQSMQMERVLVNDRSRGELSRIRRMGLFNEVVDRLILAYRTR